MSGSIQSDLANIEGPFPPSEPKQHNATGSGFHSAFLGSPKGTH